MRVYYIVIVAHEILVLLYRRAANAQTKLCIHTVSSERSHPHTQSLKAKIASGLAPLDICIRQVPKSSQLAHKCFKDLQ